MNRLLLFLFLPLFFISTSLAQVVELQPTFVTQNDTVTVIFDATQGNGALVGVSQVYAHTGVITNLSTSPTDWRHVKGNWGTDDASVRMTNIGNNKHQIKYKISTFYNIPSGETVEKLAFVFRNQSGNVVGRDADGGDIFVPIFTGGFAATMLSPTLTPMFVTTNDTIEVKIATSQLSTIQLFVDGNLLNSLGSANQLTFNLPLANYSSGKYYLHFSANNGTQTITDSTYFIIQPNNVFLNPPSGIKDGINYINDTTVILQIFAPGKNFVYVVGDFNNWEHDLNYLMKRNTAGNRFWIEISGLTPQQEYRFQYAVDAEVLKIADPYSEKVLDPWNDPYIPNSTYPNLIPYPVGKGNNIVSVLQTAQAPYNWDNSINFTAPNKANLVVYELLIRDFTTESTYNSAIEKLDYLKGLGINCIHIMPPTEFEGNISWGYNISFFMAPDKYYGTKNDLKKFVEECHKRGIAIVIDMVLNHSFGQNPQARLWFDEAAGKPSLSSPFFNRDAKHDFNVGYDYNHESPATIDFVKRVVQHWVEEYKIDGYRFDLSKGFTQNNTLGNISAWGALDQSRINIWKRIRDNIYEVKQDPILILEHFANNDEEKILSDEGFLLWGNINHEYSEGAMGYSSDLSWISWKQRGWNHPSVLGYMESHDEERLMYKNLNFGSTVNNYNIKSDSIAMKRMELASTFLFTVPGPKMMWQFGELAYPYSINYCQNGTVNNNCRTDPKPIRWDYLSEQNRVNLKNVNMALIHLKVNNPAFSSDDFTTTLNGTMKKIKITHSTMNVIVLGNFGTGVNSINPTFHNAGWWYDYFSGDSINVSDPSATISLQRGEYKIYTSKKINLPDFPLSDNQLLEKWFNSFDAQIYPNPSLGNGNIKFTSSQKENCTIMIHHINGSLAYNFDNIEIPQGEFTISLQSLNGFEGLSSGIYVVSFRTQNQFKSQKLIVK